MLFALVLTFAGAVTAGNKKCPFVVNPKSGTVCVGESITFDALEGNTGKGLRLCSVSQPINGGKVTINRTCNTFTYYAPEVAPPSCEDSFTYTLKDCSGERKTASVTITFLCCIPCTVPLEVNNKSGVVCSGASITFDALAGNSGCDLMLISVTQPTFGTVTISGNDFTYTANEDVPAGTVDSFLYTLSAQGIEMSAMVQVRIITEPFVINPLMGTVCAGSSITFDALASNSGCNASLVEVTPPPANQGTVTCDCSNNTFTYTSSPLLPQGTVVTFSYTIQSNGEQMSAPVTVTIINEPLIVNPVSIVVCPLQKATFDITAFNNGCELTLVDVSTPLFGTAQAIGNIVEYQAPATVPDNGIDTFDYTVSSPNAPEATATVTVTIVPSLPFIVNNLFGTVASGDTIVFNPLLSSATCNPQLVSVTQPDIGTVTPDFPDITFTYNAPNLPVSELPKCTTFMYTLSEVGQSKSASVDVCIVNDPLIQDPVFGTVCPGGSVVLLPLDAGSGGARVITGVGTPVPDVGTVQFDPTLGTITFHADATALPGTTVNLSFEVALARDLAISTTGMATITIQSVPFTTADITATMGVGDTLTIDPFEFGTGCNRTLVSVTQPANGLATVTNNNATTNPQNTFTVRTLPTTPIGSVIMFTYTVADINGQRQTANVTITVVDVPFVVPDLAGMGCPGGTVTFQPLTVGSGINRQLYSVTQPTTPGFDNTVTPLPASNTIIVNIPATASPGIIEFTYTIQAGTSEIGIQRKTAQVTVLIQSAPLSTRPANIQVASGGTTLVNVLAFSSGCDVQLINVSPVGVTNLGTITPFYAQNSFRYTDTIGLPAGTVIPITYELVDATGNTITGTVTITITGVVPPHVCNQTVEDPFIALYDRIILGE